MTLDEVAECFGSLYKATQALGIARANITRWRKAGYIPFEQQSRLEKMTNGKLRAKYVNRHKKID